MSETSCSETSKYLLPKVRFSFHTSYDVEFPAEGVTNSVGYLFHHFLPFKMTEKHMERLLEFGIRYKFNEFFSPEEDQRIRDNWRRFADKHGFLYEDARVFAGFMDGCDVNMRLVKRQNNQLMKLGMWPRLCRRLENRSAKQIQSRMMIIFDPHYVGKPNLVPYDDIVDTYGRMGCGENVVDIAMELRVPFLRLISAMSASKREWRRQGLSVDEILANPSVLNKRKLLQTDFRRFYNTVLVASEVSQDFIRRSMFSDRKEWKKTLKTKMANFNWVPLIPKFSKLNESDLKRAWWSLMKKMAKEFCREIDSICGDRQATVSDGAQEDAWVAALNVVMPLSPLKLPTLKLFCHALARSTNKTIRVLDRRFIDIDRLRKKLCKYGVIQNEDYTFDGCRLYLAIQTRLSTWSKRLFNHLDFPLTVRDKLRIAERCFDQLIELHGETRDDLVREGPTVTRVLLVENTIRTVLELCEGEWSPPKALQRHVRSGDLMDVISGTSGQLLSEDREKRIFRKSVFCDQNSLRVPFFNRTATAVWNSRKRSRVKATEEEGADGERMRPPKGWEEGRYSVREHATDYTEHTEIEDESDSDGNESTLANTTLDRMSETIIAGHDMTLNSQNQNLNKTLAISPIRRRKASTPPPDDVEGEEEDVYPGESQDFSHLLIGSCQPAKRRRVSPPADATADSWLDIFS